MRFLQLSLICILTLSALCTLQAQEVIDNEDAQISNPKKQLHVQIGLNTSPLLDRVLRSNIDSVNSNPYLFTAKVTRGQLGLRAGIGGRYNDKKRSEPGFRDSETRTTKGWDARFGVEWSTTLGQNDRAQLIVGLDGIGTYQLKSEIIDSGFDVISRNEQFSAWGGGPSIGFNYWLTPRFGLMLESNFYWQKGTYETVRAFKNFPELDDQITTESTNELRTMLPTSIFLVYRF